LEQRFHSELLRGLSQTAGYGHILISLLP